MNRNSPDYYREPSADASVKATIQLIDHIRSLNSPLVKPIVTPRFAISCTNDLLKDLGDLSDDGFGVNGPGGEVGENLGVDKGRSGVTIVPVVGPDGGKVELGSVVHIVVVNALL